MEKLQEQETDPWRVLLFARNGAELLLVQSTSGVRLPEFRVPRWQRIIPNLNAKTKRLWNLETVGLFPFSLPHPERATVDCRYYAMEVCNPEGLARLAPNVVPLSTLKEISFADKQDYLAVQQGIGFKAARFPKGCEGPFSGFAAVERVSAWVDEQLKPLGRHWEGTFCQLQASASFALLRFQTNRGAVWFKAVGEPNRREFPITKALTRRFPKYLPEVIAVREDWNAWLAEEVIGKDLFSSRASDSWSCAARSLAQLQIDSIEHAAQILDTGAHDARSARLLHLVVPFFSAIESLMEAQIKPVPRRLTAREIRTVAQQVIETLAEIKEAGVPDALNHFDLNPGNVIVHTGNGKFLDWAEAGVGNPFLSMEYLRQHFLQRFSGERDAAIEFRNSYSSAWRSRLPDSTVERMFELIPLIAAFAFAATALPWNDPDVYARPGIAGFLRSLARRMHCECEQLSCSAA